MSDLIARLESATEGSRELDIAVNLAATGKFLHHLAPRYTTSIDAALTLVPGGFRWKLAMTGVGKAAARVEMWTIHFVAHPLPAFAKAKGFLAPTAICAAALRARGL